MTINNEQLSSEIGALKDENKQLTSLLEKMAVNNEIQMQQINSQSSEIGTLKDENIQLKTEIDMIKDENTQLKVENNVLKTHLVTSSSFHHYSTSHRVIPKIKPQQVSQCLAIT